MTQDTIKVIFLVNDKEIEIEASIGLSILDVTRQHHIDELEGACEGSLACATCHVILEERVYQDLLTAPTEAEEDMLDLAFGLTHTSRLGCQILLAPELDGMRIRIPTATRNL
jgi:ferredoxin